MAAHKRSLVIMVLLANMLLLSPSTFAQPVQLNRAGLHLNGNLISAEDKNKLAFLIVHGTWAHASMELPLSLQTLLEAEGYASLAITLSLGIDNRQGFFDCKSPIVQGHEAAIAEIHAWYLFLRKQGYDNVVLIGHSRGGAQAALYQQRYPQDQLVALALIAPMVWQADVEAKAYKDKFGLDLDARVSAAEKSLKENINLFTPPGILYCKKTPVSPRAFIGYYSAMPEKNTPTLLKNTTVPAIIYLGDKDPISKAFVEQKTYFVANKNISIFTVEGADHFFRDLYADELIEDLLERLP